MQSLSHNKGSDYVHSKLWGRPLCTLRTSIPGKQEMGLSHCGTFPSVLHYHTICTLSYVIVRCYNSVHLCIPNLMSVCKLYCWGSKQSLDVWTHYAFALPSQVPGLQVASPTY